MVGWRGGGAHLGRVVKGCIEKGFRIIQMTFDRPRWVFFALFGLCPVHQSRMNKKDANGAFHLSHRNYFTT